MVSSSVITFNVIDGVDKGRVFTNLIPPVTIGREEGNTIRLNDERISRFHAKVQFDQGDLILTDLDSTNGTRLNGQPVQVHRLRHGDCVLLGRSVLLYGSPDEISARFKENQHDTSKTPALVDGSATVVNPDEGSNPHFTIAEAQDATITNEALQIGKQSFPPLPQKLSPSQAARLAEIVNYMHRSLSQILPVAQINEAGTQVTMDFATWQRVVQVNLLLARYYRAVTDP